MLILPLVFMDSTIVGKIFHYCLLAGGMCHASARPLTGVQHLTYFPSTRSQLVSQRERQILFQMIGMQISGENFLMIHIPK